MAKPGPKPSKTHLDTKPSKAKSEVARTRERVGGRFVPKDPEAAFQKKLEATELRIKTEGFSEDDKISEEDRETFKTDALKFFELGLYRSPTWYEGLKYAKEILKYQYPSLSTIENNTNVTVTQKVLSWQWGNEDQQILEGEVNDVPSDTDSIQTLPDASKDT
jgi:hypothetical protein